MTFKIQQGDGPVRIETLSQDIIKVGKLPSSHLRIEDENVSRMHAVIEVTGPEEIYIIDLGSAAGTIVNGKKVNKCKLQNGDEIVLGGARVTVEIGAASVAGEDDVTMMASRAEAKAAVAAAPEPARPAAAPAANPFSSGAAMGALANPFAAPANPFAAAAAPVAPSYGGGHGGHGGHGDDDGDPDHYQYGIAASGPPVNPADVETAASAAEVVVMWGDVSVLHVAHLSPPRSFYIGEPSGKKSPDYLVDGSVLGADRIPLVVESGGNVAVVIPAGAEGEVSVGEQSLSFEDLRAQGKLGACAELSGAQQYILPQGATAKVRYKGFTFVTKATSAGRKVGTAGATDWTAQLWTGVSLAVHTAFLLMFYFLPPRPASLSLDLLNADSRLVQYLMEPPETVEEETPEWLQEQQQEDDTEGGTGKRHKDDEGAMGEESHEKTTNRFGIEGPEDNPDPVMAREQARDDARQAASQMGALLQMAGAWNSPTSPYGAESALGADPMSALGALMGDQIGGNFGFGGLGLRGTGRGGGGTGEGTIGLGNLGTIGHGSGTGSGSGYGSGAGGFHGRGSAVPHIRTGEADVRGSLSREVIRRVIRRHINEVRFCYEQELAQRPDLAGRITVSFIISATGAVQTASVMNTTLNNARVEGCVVQAVRRWTFPAPDGGGVVGVNYPFVLDSTGGGEDG